MAPGLKILGVPTLPPGGSLGTGKRRTLPKIWHALLIFLARVNGIFLFLIYIYDSKQAACNYNLVASSGALAQWYEKVFVSIQFAIGIDQQ